MDPELGALAVLAGVGLGVDGRMVMSGVSSVDIRLLSEAGDPKVELESDPSFWGSTVFASGVQKDGQGIQGVATVQGGRWGCPPELKLVISQYIN